VRLGRLVRLGALGSGCAGLGSGAVAVEGLDDAKVALGAVVMRVPAVTDLDRDPLEVIETGDWVRVDGDAGIVEVVKRAQRAPE